MTPPVVTLILGEGANPYNIPGMNIIHPSKDGAIKNDTQSTQIHILGPC